MSSEMDERALPNASKEVSSSDCDDEVTGHWSLSPDKHCLLSADQLQLELWRDELRQEIEEDLQRQVRDRLGLSQLHITNCIQSSIDTHSSHLIDHSRQVLPQSCPQTPQLKIADELCLADKQSPGLSNDKGNQGQEQPKTVSSNVSKQPFKMHLVQSSPAENHLPANGTLQSTKRERRQTLSEYVNVKYGVPSDQLLHLSSTGSFRTRVVDTAGLGGGPFIHVPVEANILFPTPSHVSSCSLLKSLSPDHDNSSSQFKSSKTNHGHVQVEGSIWCQSNSLMPAGQDNTKASSIQSTPFVFGTKQIVYSGGAKDVVTSHNGLQFEARFEGGNLQQAVQVGAYEYRLSLNSDLYSTKHTQWFYFKVEGMVSMTTYTFHIINFYKPDSLYNYGMQPLLYSSHNARLTGVGWSRVGTNVHYYSQTSLSAKKYYALTWEMVFPHTEDVCYLAYCYPYPYTKLINLIDMMEKCPHRSKHVHRESLCKSLSGNDCPLLTITDYDGLPHDIQSRSGIVVSARIHPGETNSSWMMEGLLEMLTEDTPHAKVLRSQFVFKVIPMLNPDGVIVGNYRTSLAGVDLNRVYKNTVPELFPTIFHTKAVIDSFMSERKVALYIDLHGHSRKHNVFMYGCHASQCDQTQLLNERVFPFLLSQQVPQMFSYSSCKFNVHRSKEATGRVVVWRRGVSQSFTMEATFCGSTLGHNPQFTAEDFMEMGRSLGEAIYKFHQAKISNSYQQKVLGQLAEVIMQSVKKPSANLPDLVTTHNDTSSIHGDSTTAPTKKGKSCRKSLRRFMKFDISHIQESSTSGSDSDNDSFDFKRKKSRAKNPNRRSSLHTRTQPLLPSQPGHTEHQAHQPREHRPQRLVAGRITSHSQVPLPPLTLFSAPPRLQGGGERKTALGWKYINKYKDRSNGGIPMFSEERMKERAEKQRLHSLSALPSSTSDVKEELSQGNENHQKIKAKVRAPFLWQPDNTDLPVTKDDESFMGMKSLVARQRLLRGHELSMLNTEREKRHSRRHDHMTSLRHYNHARHLAASKAMGAHPSSGCGQTKLPPALVKYIRELWSKTE